MMGKASVVVMAIAILALIFIVATVLLFATATEREVAIRTKKENEMKAIFVSMDHSALLNLRNDVVGADGVPYN